MIEERNQMKDKLQQDIIYTYALVLDSSILEPINGYEVSINLKENTTPVFRKAYNVPYSLQDKVHKELLKLQRQNIISPVTYSLWTTSIVVVPIKQTKLEYVLILRRQ